MLGKRPLLPASTTCSKKTANISQTQLTERTHSQKLGVRVLLPGTIIPLVAGLEEEAFPEVTREDYLHLIALH